MPRKINEIKYSLNFLKHLSRLPRRIAEGAKERELKLHGKDQDSWAFWIDYTYRIKFIFLNEGEILFLDVGTHDMYR